MKLDAGDVVLVPFPFTNLTSSKTRPAFVLSLQDCNEGAQDVLVCGMTSNLRRSDHSVLIETGDMVEGELKATSRAKVDKIVALQQDLIRSKVGSVKGSVLERVIKELLSILPNP